VVEHTGHVDDMIDIETANKDFKTTIRDMLKNERIAEQDGLELLRKHKLLDEEVEEHKRKLDSKMKDEIFEVKRKLKHSHDELVQALDYLGSSWNSDIGNEIKQDCEEIDKYLQTRKTREMACESVLLNPSIIAKADFIQKFTAENCHLPVGSKVFSASSIIQQLTDVAAALSAKITLQKSSIPVYVSTLLATLNLAPKGHTFQILYDSSLIILYVVDNEMLVYYDKKSKLTHSLHASPDKIIDAVITKNNTIVYTTLASVISISLSTTDKIIRSTPFVNANGLFIDGDNNLLLTAGCKIHRSSDKGISWDVLCSSPDKSVKLLRVVSVKIAFQALVDLYWVVEQNACETCILCEFTVHLKPLLTELQNCMQNIACNFEAPSEVAFRRNAYRLTEIAMEDICRNDDESFTRRVITGAPKGIINNKSRLAYDGQDHVFMSDGLANGGVHLFFVSSRSYVRKILSFGYYRPVTIAYDAAARHLHVGVVTSVGQVSIRSYSATYPAITAPPPSLIPVDQVTDHPPSSVAVSDVKAVTNQSRCVVAASSGTALLGTETTIDIYTDIITPCLNRFTTKSLVP
jgi:hypothetical protein